MRTIKFRAWDNVKFKMYYVGESEEVVFALDSNGITATDITEHDWNFKKLEHLQYMQFTGLHDKNGTPIYEGDIYHMGDRNITYTVVWNDTGLTGKQNGSSSYAGLSSWRERIEVNGNIHEGVTK